MEVKWDEIRAQVVFDGRSVAVRSRPGRICTDQFPELHELGDVLGARRVVLDGELVCLGADGKPDFAALRPRLGVRGSRAAAAQRRNPSQLMVFDGLSRDSAISPRLHRGLPVSRPLEILAASVPHDGQAPVVAKLRPEGEAERR